MYCKNCGKEISENGKFCTYCGAENIGNFQEDTAEILVEKDNTSNSNSTVEKSKKHGNAFSEEHMKLLGKFEGYRNTKFVAWSIVKRIFIGVFMVIIIGMSFTIADSNLDIPIGIYNVIKNLFKIGLGITIFMFFIEAKNDGEQIFEVYKNINRNLVIKGKDIRGKSYMNVIDKITFIDKQKIFRNKVGEKIKEERFECADNEVFMFPTLFVFYHLENDDKTIEQIIKDNEIDIHMHYQLRKYII